MKYKVGDKIWIREDLILYKGYDGYNFQINYKEIDIRGKQVEITDVGGTSYSVIGYRGITEIMIDHDKTNNTSTEPQYEIY